MLTRKRPQEVQRFYTTGKQQEHYVLRWLKEKGYVVKHSTPTEDKQLDIDLWIELDGKQVGVSVKTNEPQFFTKPFVFETGVDTQCGRYYDSWFHTSKADYYLVWKRDSETTGVLFLISTRRLHAHVEKYGFDAERTTTPKVAAREVATGKKVTYLGLLKQETLKTKKVARRVGYLDISKLPEEKLTTRKIR